MQKPEGVTVLTKPRSAETKSGNLELESSRDSFHPKGPKYSVFTWNGLEKMMQFGITIDKGANAERHMDIANV